MDAQLWMGNLKPSGNGTKPFARLEGVETDRHPEQKHAIVHALANQQFSVGYEHRKRNTDEKMQPEDKEDAVEGHREEYGGRPPSVKHIVQDVNQGDLIIVPVYGIHDDLRLIGKFTGDAVYRDEGMQHVMDVHYARDVDWVTAHVEELPESLQDRYARPVVQRAKVDPELIEEVGELYRKRKEEQEGTVL